MIKQTRGAIRFLLADYRAVLKYAMIAAAGIALASPSFAKITINGNEGQQTVMKRPKSSCFKKNLLHIFHCVIENNMSKKYRTYFERY